MFVAILLNMIPSNRKTHKQNNLKISRRYKASTTIELAMMMPVLLLVITGVIHVSFYYHDKNIIYGKVYELEAIGVQQDRLSIELDTQELMEHYYESIEGKLLLFSEISCHVTATSMGITISVAAEKGFMSIKIDRLAPIYYVEQNIRLLQPIKDK